MPLVAVKISLA